MTTPPFFIIGNPRSGTTLLRLMLGSNPNIIVPPECGYIEWWYEKYKQWNKTNVNKNYVRTYINDLRQSRKIETWKLNYLELEETILQKKPNNYAELCAVVHMNYRKNQNNSKLKLWGDKNNYYIDKMQLLLQLYPRAKFLFIIRDGRDVACSYRKISKIKTKSIYKPELALDIEEIAKEWVRNNEIIINFSNTLDDSRFIFIKYEQLLSNTYDELTKLCELLDIGYHPNMIEYYLNHSNKIVEPEELLPWKKMTREKPNPKNIGKYKNELSFTEIEKFQKIAGNMLKYFEYNTFS